MNGSELVADGRLTDPAALRRGFAAFATGVTVVTVGGDSRTG